MGVSWLENWICGSGGIISGVEVRTDERGERGERGVFATRDLAPGELLLRIPNGILVTGNFARRDSVVAAVFQAVDDANLEDTLEEYASSDKDTAAIVVLLIAEVARIKSGKESVWKPWIDSLPKSFNSPVTVPQEVLDRRLMSSPVHIIATEIRAELEVLFKKFLVPFAVERFPDAFPPHVVTYDLFLWAHCVTESRAFDMSEGSVKSAESAGTSQGMSVLAPFADMINHCSDPTRVNACAKRWCPPCISSVQSDTVGFQVSVGCHPVQKGSEVLISYGSLDNARLLLHYGFAELPNPSDQIKLTLCEPEDNSVDLTAKKELLLGLANGGALGTVHELNIDDPLPGKLLASVRLLSMTEEEAASVTIHTDFGQALSQRNENATVSFLKDVLCHLSVNSSCACVDEFTGKYANFERFCAVYMQSSQDVIQLALSTISTLTKDAQLKCEL